MKKEKLLLTVTINPAIDKAVELDKFRYGEMNRIDESSSSIAGKGYHAAIVNKTLGGDSFCLGFSFKHSRIKTGKFFLTNNVASEFVEVPGDIRVNLKIFDRDTSIITEINEKGKAVDEKQIESLFTLIEKYHKVGDMIVFSGSVPPGTPDTIYKDLIASAKKAGLKTALDAEGSLLLKGIESVPYFVKTGASEIEKCLGRIITNFEDAAEVSRYFTDKGVKIVCISLGMKGAVLSDGKKCWSAEAPQLEVLSTVGSKDSMVGAVCNAVLKEEKPDYMLRSGVAAFAATAMLKSNELCSLESYKVLFDQIKVLEM